MRERGEKERGGGKARVTAISRLKSRRVLYLVVGLSNWGRGWRHRYEAAKRASPFIRGRKTRGKKTSSCKGKGWIIFFFATPRRLFHILIKPERGEGQRRTGN